MRLTRFLAPLTLAGALIVAPTAAQATVSPDAPCHVAGQLIQVGTSAFSGWDVGVTTTGDCSKTEVSLALWSAPSVSGNPISAQVLSDNIFDGLLTSPTEYFEFKLSTCFYQLDLAYGPVPKDLTTPYGKRLIADWHGGTTDCTAPPTIVPPTPIVSSPPVTTAPPTTEPPVTTTPPVEVVTTPPAVVVPTTPAPVPSKSSTPPSRKPQVKPKPKPTDTNPGRGTGCVGTGCVTPKPTPTAPKAPAAVGTTPKPTLPFTGASTDILAALGGAVLGSGLVLLFLSHKRRV